MKKFTLALAAVCLVALALAGCSLTERQQDAAAQKTAATDPLTGLSDPLARPALCRSVPVQRGPTPHASGHWRGVGGAGSPHRRGQRHQPLPGLPRPGGRAQGRPGVPGPVTSICSCWPASRPSPSSGRASIYAANLLDLYEDRPSGRFVSGGELAFPTKGNGASPTRPAGPPAARTCCLWLRRRASHWRSSPSSPIQTRRTPKPTTQLPPLLPFGEPAGGKEGASSVEVIFSASASTRFTYDSGTGKYLMARADGSPQTDANTDTQAGFDNLLILYSAPSRRDDGYTWGYDLTMGAGVYLNGGSVWSILWMPGVDSTLAIYNSDGTALDIRPGTSYIALMGSVAGQELILRDSAGSEMTAT